MERSLVEEMEAAREAVARSHVRWQPVKREDDDEPRVVSPRKKKSGKHKIGYRGPVWPALSTPTARTPDYAALPSLTV